MMIKNELVIKIRIMINMVIRTKVMIRNREMMTATNMVIKTRIMVRIEMVEWLLEHGAAARDEDGSGNTPLHCAALGGDTSWSAKKPKSLFGETPLLKMFLLMY